MFSNAGFTIQAKEHIKIHSNATLFLSVHFRNYVCWYSNFHWDYTKNADDKMIL